MSNHDKGPAIMRVTRPDNGQRYSIVIPEGYDESRPWPLVIALHWGGPVTPFYGYDLLIGLIEPALRGLEAIFVAPDCASGEWANDRGEADVLSLCDHLFKEFNLDQSKVLLSGYSMGGIGTWYIASRHQDRFVAALPIAANPPKEVISVKWRIPLYVIHGQEDEYFPIEFTEHAVNGLKDSNASIEFVSLPRATHFAAGDYLSAIEQARPWIEKCFQATSD